MLRLLRFRACARPRPVSRALRICVDSRDFSSAVPPPPPPSSAAASPCPSPPPLSPSRDDKAVLTSALTALSASDGALARAADASLAIPSQLWPSVSSALRRRLVHAPASVFPGEDAASRFSALVSASAAFIAASGGRGGGGGGGGGGSSAPLISALLGPLGVVARDSFGEQIEAAALLRRCADLRQPHTWYPHARALRRRIVFHAGPTNSGKTFRALQALKRAHSGVYAGPLRLLALEVYESLNGDGVYASLETGQERREMPFARHAACTVEMLSTERRVDVAVIDEIQMIGDRQRGAAFTRALLGVVAPEVHVCGDPAALPAVAALAALCGDALEVLRYERLGTLTTTERSLESDYSRIEAGDCVVAFSRKDVYAIRRAIERKTAHRCCVVYGSLPPETRSQQSRLFNDPASGFRVLVATDAIGMGLNLHIRRVVFHALEKYDGAGVGPVPPGAVKQIAGRAGRAGSRFPRGWATTLHPADLPYLRACLAAPPEPIGAAGLFPNAEQLIRFAELLPPGTLFSTLIAKFVLASHLDGPYFMCRDSTIKQVAALLQPFPLSLPERCALALVPINLRNIDVRGYFSHYLAQFCAARDVRLDLQLPLASPGYLGRDLEALETKVQALDVYVWLGQRLGPFGFPDLARAADMRREASELLEQALSQMSEATKGDWELSLRTRRERAQQQQLQQQQRWAQPAAAAALAPGVAGFA